MAGQSRKRAKCEKAQKQEARGLWGGSEPITLVTGAGSSKEQQQRFLGRLCEDNWSKASNIILKSLNFTQKALERHQKWKRGW